MKWKVKGKDSEILLTPETLFHSLAKGALKQPKPQHLHITNVMLEILEAQGELKNMSANQLAVMAFDIGYFYKVFLKNNNVELIESSDDDVDKE